MKIKLHKPRQSVWIVSLVLLILGLVATFVSVPILSQYAFLLIVLSAALLLLGTWVI
jgi:hypothetical protein